MKRDTTGRSEFGKFDEAMGKIAGVSHKELQRREAKWREGRKRKKRARSASRASRA